MDIACLFSLSMSLSSAIVRTSTGWFTLVHYQRTLVHHQRTLVHHQRTLVHYQRTNSLLRCLKLLALLHSYVTQYSTHASIQASLRLHVTVEVSLAAGGQGVAKVRVVAADQGNRVLSFVRVPCVACFVLLFAILSFASPCLALW